MADSDHSGPTEPVPGTGNIEIPPDEDSGVSGDSSSSVDDSSSLSWGQLDALGSGLRLVSETVMRKQFVDMEMARAREAWRVKGEKRRAELEDELTRMVVQTQLQIAGSVVASRKPQNKKRKRGEDEDISVSASSSSKVTFG